MYVGMSLIQNSILKPETNSFDDKVDLRVLV